MLQSTQSPSNEIEALVPTIDEGTGRIRGLCGFTDNVPLVHTTLLNWRMQIEAGCHPHNVKPRLALDSDAVAFLLTQDHHQGSTDCKNPKAFPHLCTPHESANAAADQLAILVVQAHTHNLLLRMQLVGRVLSLWQDQLFSGVLVQDLRPLAVLEKQMVVNLLTKTRYCDDWQPRCVNPRVFPHICAAKREQVEMSNAVAETLVRVVRVYHARSQLSQRCIGQRVQQAAEQTLHNQELSPTTSNALKRLASTMLHESSGAGEEGMASSSGNSVQSSNEPPERKRRGRPPKKTATPSPNASQPKPAIKTPTSVGKGKRKSVYQVMVNGQWETASLQPSPKRSKTVQASQTSPLQPSKQSPGVGSSKSRQRSSLINQSPRTVSKVFGADHIGSYIPQNQLLQYGTYGAGPTARTSPIQHRSSDQGRDIQLAAANSFVALRHDSHIPMSLRNELSSKQLANSVANISPESRGQTSNMGPEIAIPGNGSSYGAPSSHLYNPYSDLGFPRPPAGTTYKYLPNPPVVQDLSSGNEPTAAMTLGRQPLHRGASDGSQPQDFTAGRRPSTVHPGASQVSLGMPFTPSFPQAPSPSAYVGDGTGSSEDSQLKAGGAGEIAGREAIPHQEMDQRERSVLEASLGLLDQFNAVFDQAEGNPSQVSNNKSATLDETTASQTKGHNNMESTAQEKKASQASQELATPKKDTKQKVDEAKKSGADDFDFDEFLNTADMEGSSGDIDLSPVAAFNAAFDTGAVEKKNFFGSEADVPRSDASSFPGLRSDTPHEIDQHGEERSGISEQTHAGAVTEKRGCTVRKRHSRVRN